ncbi:MAG: PEP-CTERM sorting domain-containing protein [Myxococcota bacterium]|nr:PEP-CTERM sorting domain-containing protein [Myxococcota bacterium]
MRKLIVLLATAGLLLGFTSSAQAGEFDPPSSTLGLALGGLPAITVSGLSGTESLVTLGAGSILGLSTGHNIGIAGTVWSTINFGPGTSLFTGVPLISNLKVTVSNRFPHLLQDGFVVASNQVGGGGAVGPGFGGLLRMNGQTVIHALAGVVKLGVPLAKLGGLMGETTMVSLIGNNITVTNGPFMTNAWKITGITGNIITLPARGNVQGVAFTLNPTSMETAMTPSTNGGYASISGGQPFENNTVTITGTNNLASAASSIAGQVTVIAPLRVFTGAIAGNIPGAGIVHMEFVPEPGTVLLLVSGAVGLAVIGRRRMRK